MFVSQLSVYSEKDDSTWSLATSTTPLIASFPSWRSLLVRLIVLVSQLVKIQLVLLRDLPVSFRSVLYFNFHVSLACLYSRLFLPCISHRVHWSEVMRSSSSTTETNNKLESKTKKKPFLSLYSWVIIWSIVDLAWPTLAALAALALICLGEAVLGWSGGAFDCWVRSEYQASAYA